jgi:hypothetical protein
VEKMRTPWWLTFLFLETCINKCESLVDCCLE